MPIATVGIDSGEAQTGGVRGSVLPAIGFLLAGLILISAAIRMVRRHREPHHTRYAGKIRRHDSK